MNSREATVRPYRKRKKNLRDGCGQCGEQSGEGLDRRLTASVSAATVEQPKNGSIVKHRQDVES